MTVSQGVALVCVTPIILAALALCLGLILALLTLTVVIPWALLLEALGFQWASEKLMDFACEVWGGLP